MGENVLGTEERTFTIEDLHQKRAEAEALEAKNQEISKELEEIIDREENEIGEKNYER